MRLIALVTLLLLAPLATAGEGDRCLSVHRDSTGAIDSGPTCTESPGTRIWFLCDKMVATGTKTLCGPIRVPAEGSHSCVIDLLTTQAACTLTTMTVEETDVTIATDGTPETDAVWTTLGTLTGTPSPLLSQIDPLRSVGPIVRATFADLTTGGCTNVSVVVKCFY